MIIEEAIKTFLTDATDGDQTQSARNTARSAIASDIGLRVYLGRRPQGSTGPAVTLRRVTSQRYDDLAGEDGTVQHRVDVNVWTKRDSVPPAKVCDIADNIRQALGQYRGTMGDVTVLGVTLERDAMEIVIPPRDGSDDWSFVYSMEFKLTYGQTAVTAL